MTGALAFYTAACSAHTDFNRNLIARFSVPSPMNLLHRALAFLVAAWVALSIGVSAPAPAAPPADAAPAKPARYERWSVVLMEGKRAGHMVVIEEPVRSEPGADKAQQDLIRTRTAMKIEIKRGPLTIPINTESVWLETAGGEPVSLESTFQLGAMPTKKTYTFTAQKGANNGDGPGRTVTLKSKTGSQVQERQVPWPGGETQWFTPAAARRHMIARLAAGDKQIKIRAVEDDPTAGLVAMEATRTVIERTTCEVFGRVVPAIKWKSEVDRYPGIEVIEFADDSGESIRSETTIGGIQMVTMLADKDLALAAVDAPELLDSSLVKPDRPIANPRRLAKGTYLLSLPEKAGEAGGKAAGSMPDLPTTSTQRVERVDARSVRVRVTKEPGPAPVRGEGDRAEFIGASTMINTADEEVVALVKDALPGDDAALPADQRAEKLRRFVYRFIKKKEMSVGFASATETARTRTGDCSEHGVLLAALLRVNGIPSRVASGLIYADAFAGMEHIFGYHMWAQAWLPDATGESRWVDLDGTLPPGTPFDATHITLGVSSLADGGGGTGGAGGSGNFMVALAPLLKRLQIKVEEDR